MVHRDLFKEPIGQRPLPRPEHIYLEPHFDLLGEGPLGEHGLDLRHDGRVDDAPLGPDGVHLLADARDDGEVLGKVGREDTRDAVRVQILQLGRVCAGRERKSED